MITVSEQAARAIHALCASRGESPSVRVRGVGAGRPLPVAVSAERTHRLGDQVAAADGVVVLVARELADAVNGHTLDVWAVDESDTPRFVFTAPQN